LENFTIICVFGKMKKKRLPHQKKEKSVDLRKRGGGPKILPRAFDRFFVWDLYKFSGARLG